MYFGFRLAYISLAHFLFFGKSCSSGSSGMFPFFLMGMIDLSRMNTNNILLQNIAVRKFLEKKAREKEQDEKEEKERLRANAAAAQHAPGNLGTDSHSNALANDDQLTAKGKAKRKWGFSRGSQEDKEEELGLKPDHFFECVHRRNQTNESA